MEQPFVLKSDTKYIFLIFRLSHMPYIKYVRALKNLQSLEYYEKIVAVSDISILNLGISKPILFSFYLGSRNLIRHVFVTIKS